MLQNADRRSVAMQHKISLLTPHMMLASLCVSRVEHIACNTLWLCSHIQNFVLPQQVVPAHIEACNCAQEAQAECLVSKAQRADACVTGDVASAHQPAPSAAVAEVQGRLRSFLKQSSKYDSRLVLARIRGSSLWQEQVILHNKVHISVHLCSTLNT